MSELEQWMARVAAARQFWPRGVVERCPACGAGVQVPASADAMAVVDAWWAKHRRDCPERGC